MNEEKSKINEQNWFGERPNSTAKFSGFAQAHMHWVYYIHIYIYIYIYMYIFLGKSGEAVKISLREKGE